MILLEYLDINLTWKKNKPIFKFIIKTEKRKTKEFPLKCIVNNKRISKTGKEYYIHYLGEIGEEVYNERKKLYSMYSLIPFYIKTYNKDVEKLNEYLKILKSNNVNGIKKFYLSEKGAEARKIQSEWGIKHSMEISSRNRKLWKEDEYVNKVKSNQDYSYENHGKKISDFYKNQKNKDFIKSVMNSPKRIEKISLSSKKMWEHAKSFNKEMYYRMINSQKHKNFELNGYKLNNIEYLVGSILNNFSINWEYEKIFQFKTTCYLPDFYVRSKNLIIECYGDYWHANPKYLNENDFTHKNRSVKDVWAYDSRKKEIFENNEFSYLFFWENDILNNIDGIKKTIYEYTR